MDAFRIIAVFLVVTCLYNDVTFASDMSVAESNGLAALKLKIEAEQIQDENAELLQRIINLADDILAEAADAVDELAPAGKQVKIDAQQNNDYMVDHCGSVKEIAYKLWKDGKNVTVEMEDIAEFILDTESAKQMGVEPQIGEESSDDMGESDDEDDDDEGDDDEDDDDEDEDDDDDEEGDDEDDEEGDDEDDEDVDDDAEDEEKRKRRSPTTETAEIILSGTTEGGEELSTPVVDINTTLFPMTMEPPVNVEEEAEKIAKLADQLRSEFEQDIQTIIVLCHEMKIVMEFQAYNIFVSEQATAESQKDIRDTEEEITAFCDRIIDASTTTMSQNSKSMDVIKTYALGIKNEEM